MPPSPHSAVFSALAHGNNYRRTVKAEHLADLILDISLIRKMEQLGIIAEDNEHRRLDRRLSDVVYLEPSALICRRLNAHNSVAEHIVEHTGGNTHAGLLVNTVDKFEELSDALTGLGRYEHYRRQVRCGSCPQMP